jgi:FAD/FMN-containing dehydrogenase/Fe-S oxidoreductase
VKNSLDKLAQSLDGELHDSNMMKALYATDASVYRELPLAIALPKHAKDIQELIKFTDENNTSLIPRAGGTSLAGQCVGNGIIVDISKYMNQILEINENEKWVRVQPGVVRDELNVFLEQYGLFFGPNTSTSNRCNIGGMVGNNSCGSTSIVYGSTRDHVLELRTILSDGSEVTFHEMDVQSFENKQKGDTLESQVYRQIANKLTNVEAQQEIIEHFPKASVTRRNTGYALDSLLNTAPFSDTANNFNFCKVLCGSEGTLAFTTEIKLNLVELPKPNDVIVAAHFDSIHESMKATVIAMQNNPSACELMDKTILECTKNNIEQQKNRFFIQGDPAVVLMIEFRADSLEEAKILAINLIESFKQNELGFAFPIITGNQTKNVWNLRKAGLGLLANIPGDKKTVACVEDTAVAVTDLPEYIEEFSEMMNSFNQKAVYYAHAGAGELHLRPILNLKLSKDVHDFKEISKASAKLVKKYQGSLSGEHGDGRVRSEFIPLVLGEKNYELFKDIKNTWDPKTIFNPGKIVDAKPMEADLRYKVDVETLSLETVFNFDETGGILRTVEKCNGSGDCRKLNFAGGTMCPSYRATLNEQDTTRGRANVLREFLTQNAKENPFNHPEIKTVMDLCISCKGCKSECPSNIDMATLKAEFQYQYNKSNAIPLRTKLIANSTKLNKLASKFSGLHNILINQYWIKSLLGFSTKRTLPKLKKQTLRQWFKKYDQKNHKHKVYLFCDEYTNYYDVEIGRKAIYLLNTLGYQVLLIEHQESGRAFISKGFLNEAKNIAEQNVSTFKSIIKDEIPLLGIEPSCILSFRDEYPNLVASNKRSEAQKLSNHVFLIDEFISSEIRKGKIERSLFSKANKTILLHGHCHQKALSSQDHTIDMLSIPENFKVEVIDSGCCGMAGGFGYEKEHYDISMKIGNQVLFPKVNSVDENVIISAPGTSCRHQIKDGTNRVALHPVEILYNALLK